MSTPVLLNKEYYGLPPPPNASIPTPVDLLRLCTGKHPQHYNLGLAYPPEAPVFWIKYGTSVIWNELSAQAMVHEELRRLGSPVRAPAVYYACELALPSQILCGELIHGYKSYVVMEYIPGKTAGEWLESAQDAATKDAIYAHVALALSELHRIPVPPGSRPAAIDGGRIWHSLFDEGHAPRQYDSVTQLEDHLNLFLSIAKRKQRIQGLAREPLVVCYSDIWPGNFIIDQDNNRVTIIDFAFVSILPSSFSKYAILDCAYKIQRDLSDLVVIPVTEGVDNTPALCDVLAPMVQGWSSFITCGRRLLGQEAKEPDDRLYKVLTDSRGDPIMRPMPEPYPEPPPGSFDVVVPPSNERKPPGTGAAISPVEHNCE